MVDFFARFTQKRLQGLEGVALATINAAYKSVHLVDGLKMWEYSFEDKKMKKALISENWEDCLWLMTDAWTFYKLILKTDEATDTFQKMVRSKVMRTRGYHALKEKLEKGTTEEQNLIKEKLAEYGLVL